MRSMLLPSGCAVIGLAGVASAQFAITPGGQIAGDGFYRNGAIPTSLTGNGFTPATLSASTATGTNHLFQDWWWFRAAGDTREYAFANGSVLGGPAADGSIVGTNTGQDDEGGYEFFVDNLTNPYSFRSLQIWIAQAGPFGPRIIAGNEITNTGENPLSISLFHYLDLDVNGSAGGDTYSFDTDRFMVSDGPFQLSYSGTGFSAYQGAQYDSLRASLGDPGLTNLNNTVAGSPGDFTGAFQWDIVLQPQQTLRVVSVIEFIPAPGTAGLLGLGVLVFARRRRA